MDTFDFEFNFLQNPGAADYNFYFLIRRLEGDFILVEVLGEIPVYRYYFIPFPDACRFGRRPFGHITCQDQSINQVKLHT